MKRITWPMGASRMRSDMMMRVQGVNGNEKKSSERASEKEMKTKCSIYVYIILHWRLDGLQDTGTTRINLQTDNHLYL